MRQDAPSTGPQTQQQSQLPVDSPLTSPPSSQQSSLNGLLSMVPSVLSSLGSGANGGGALSNIASSIGPLSGLLGLNKSPQPMINQANQQTTSGSGAPGANTLGANALVGNAPRSDPVALEMSPQAGAQSSLPTSGQAVLNAAPPIQQPAGANPAQAVINQVLSAYAAGQIPNELIQLGLSGRVPPQIIELALSGQVPPQLIQMVITGQIPMTTINAFLNAMQASASNAGPSPQQMPVQTQPMSRAGPMNPQGFFGDGFSSTGLFSTTKALFEALFGLNRNKQNQQQQGVSVPTLLGTIPLKMPSMPNVRSLGQMVGGTITNVASMIPF